MIFFNKRPISASFLRKSDLNGLIISEFRIPNF